MKTKTPVFTPVLRKDLREASIALKRCLASVGLTSKQRRRLKAVSQLLERRLTSNEEVVHLSERHLRNTLWALSIVPRALRHCVCAVSGTRNGK